MKHSISTVVIDENTLVREGIARVLANTQFRVVLKLAQFSEPFDDSGLDGDRALFVLGSGTNHAEMLRQVTTIKARQPSAWIVVLADQYDLRTLLVALRGGADAYLLKTMSREALVKSFELVVLGETVLASQILALIRQLEDGEPSRHVGQEQVIDQSPVGHAPRHLSEREKQILRCLVEGSSNKVIARRFDITEATVKVHLKAILRKIMVRNRTQAAIWAMEHTQLSETPEKIRINGG